MNDVVKDVSTRGFTGVITSDASRATHHERPIRSEIRGAISFHRI
jgi:hypothetical protein